MTDAERRQAVIVAGHSGDRVAAEQGLSDDSPAVRIAALGALERLGALDDATLSAAFADDSSAVRVRAAEIAAVHPTCDLLGLLADADTDVVEVAAWAAGEQGCTTEPVLARLIALAGEADEPLVREAAVAALGAIGDERAVPAIIAACADKPAVRRRAVLALAPFSGDDVDAAVRRALEDRDWQVRQAAEDLVAASSAGLDEPGDDDG